MAKQYDNSGTLSRNKDKEKEGANPNWPDFKGSITVNGQDYWLSGWVKEGEHGRFFSLSVQPKEAKQQSPRTKAAQSISDMDEDIPF